MPDITWFSSWAAEAEGPQTLCRKRQKNLKQSASSTIENALWPVSNTLVLFSQLKKKKNQLELIHIFKKQ